MQTALSLLYCGAAGKTATTMQSVLQLGSLSRENIANNFYYLLLPFKNNRMIDIANGIFVNDGYHLLPSYQSIADQQFFSTVSNVNLSASSAAAQTINKYVSGETNGQFTDLLSSASLSADNGMVAVNAIYLNGVWVSKFSKNQTVSGTPFYTSNTTSTLVDMMHTYVNYFWRKKRNIHYYIEAFFL